jgi:glycerol-3-phosphate dehydrogenase
VHLRLTKGVHVVVARGRLPIRDALVMTRGARILFAIPWGERVILGTTDTDYTGDPAAVSVDDADIAYVLDVVNATFPAAQIGRTDVVSTYAGVRPLVANSSCNGESPSEISRSHTIHSPQPGWFDVSGGKLTTYRLMAEQTVDRIERRLGGGGKPCITAQTPLLEGDTNFTGILPPPIEPAAVEHYCRFEWATHLDDIMTRRTSWSLYLKPAELSPAAAQVASWMGELLGWDEQIRRDELDGFLNARQLHAQSFARPDKVAPSVATP